jgi:vitamin B12 transporter
MHIATRTATAICLAATGLVTNAEEATSKDNLIITANRTPVASHRVIAPVDVIDAATIERSMATELSELLRFRNGMDIIRLGGPGQLTSVFTRGTNSNHTLVLIDGVRINTGGLGLAAVQNITPEMIKRVEIVKSPRTTLYGENAIGGVINVITRKPDGPEFGGFAGAGQDNAQKYGLSGGTTEGGFSISGRAQQLKNDGYPIVEGTAFDSGWDNTTVEARAGYQATRWGIEGRIWSSDGTTEYVNWPLVPASQDYENRIIAVAGSAAFTSNWSSVVDLSFATDDLEQQQSSEFAKTERTILDWQNTVQIGGDNTLVAGAYLSNEDVSGESFGFPLTAEDTDTIAVYVEDSVTLGHHALLLAGRYSDHDAIGQDFTWNIEYGFDITPDMRLTTGAGRAVRAPSASERFGAFGGNPKLEEEEALTVQGGWQWTFTEHQGVTVELFYTEIDNLIASDENFVLQNIDKAEIKGIEAGYSFATLDWSFRATGVLQDPENKTTSTKLLRRAEESAAFSLARNIGRHQVGVDLRLVGSRKDFGNQNLAGYGLTNLTGRFAFNDKWGLYGRIENLFDRDYTAAYFDNGVRYRSPGRGAYIELRYKLK